MSHFAVLLLGFAVDLFLGDPRWLPHPVQGFTRFVGRQTNGARGILAAAFRSVCVTP